MLLSTLGLALFGAQQYVASFVGGGLVVTLNFILIGFGWKMVFQKKRVALAVLIIVFKYAILGFIIYLLVKQPWLLPLGFAAGVASIMIASLIYGLTLGAFNTVESAAESSQETTKE